MSQNIRNLVIATMPKNLAEIKRNNPRDPIVNIFRLLQKDYNCTIVTPSDEQFGSQIEGTARWSGMIGMLMNETVDVALENFGISYSRHKVVRFSHYVDIEAHHILSTVPKGTDKDEDIGQQHDLMRLFWDTNFWAYVVLGFSIFIVTLFNFVMESALLLIEEPHQARLVRRQYKYRYPDLTRVVRRGRTYTIRKALQNMQLPTIAILPRQYSQPVTTPIGIYRSLFTIAYDLYGFIVAQGAKVLPKTASARIVTAFYWAGILFLVSLFASSIQTDLVVEREGDLVDSLEEVLHRADLKIIIDRGTLVEETFRTAKKGSIFRKVWDKIQKTPGESRLLPRRLLSKQVARNLMSHKYVLVRSERGLIEVGESLCKFYPSAEIHLSQDNLFDRQHGMIYRKSLPEHIREKIDKMVSIIVESGIYDYWLRNKFGIRAHCFDFHGGLEDQLQGASSLSFFNLQTLFWCLLIGNASSFVLLFAEILTANWTRCRLCLRKMLKKCDDPSKRASKRTNKITVMPIRRRHHQINTKFIQTKPFLYKTKNSLHIS